MSDEGVADQEKMRASEHLDGNFHFLSDKTGHDSDRYTGKHPESPVMNVGLFLIGKGGKVLFAGPTEQPDVPKMLSALAKTRH